jgi:hypothetical protein
MPSVTFEPALDLFHESARSRRGDQHVVALAVAAHVVGEALLAPHLALLDGAAFLLDEALDLRGEGSTSGSPRLGSAMKRIS